MTTLPVNDAQVDSRAFRLARRGRAADPDFAPEERLYRRCTIDELNPADSGRLFPDQIKFYPDWSVNRGKCCEPLDLLHLEPQYRGMGVAAFQVQDIPDPKNMMGKEMNTYRWDAQHQPLEENYPHTEIWTYKDGTHLSNPTLPEDPKRPDLPNTIKKYFRTAVSERARVILPPASLESGVDAEPEPTQSGEPIL